jgi:hypothetical protein
MLAAEKLLKFYMDSAEAQRADEIKAMLLDIKVNGLIGGGSTAEEGEDAPALDFDNISPEFRDVPVIDMGEVNKM